MHIFNFEIRIASGRVCDMRGKDEEVKYGEVIEMRWDEK